MKTKLTFQVTILILIGLLISACGGSGADETPTFSLDAVQTAAVGTFSAVLTQTALSAPSKTPTPTVTNTLLALSSPTLSNVTPFAVGGNTSSGSVSVCNGLSYVADVTIPDSTPMTPGQTFTKTWRVRNSGTCAWDAGFKFAFTGGDNMKGATYTLPQSVPANTEINISIDMTAPTNKAGNLRSNWRMSTTTGQSFGDEVYVLILVGGTTTGTAAATSAATNTAAGSTSTPLPATATETPTVATP
jgi:hypothetical protein